MKHISLGFLPFYQFHSILQNLRKHCHVEEVVQAHEIMKNVAQHIDQVKRHLEQQSRVRELSGILDGWLGPALIVLGDLVLEGILTENGKPRTVLLFETMLIITKKKEDNRLQFKASIMVSWNYTLRSIYSSKLTLEISDLLKIGNLL